MSEDVCAKCSPEDFRRILVWGTSGCGKSTLGRQLGTILSVPFFELDDLWHLPGWQTRPVAEFQEKVAELASQESWIVAGNYRNAREILLPRADMVIQLDYSKPLVMKRVIWRTLWRILKHEVCCNGNYEGCRKSFSKDSIILWAWTTFDKRKAEYAELFKRQDLVALRKLRFRSPRETQAWLMSLQPRTGDAA